METTEKKIKTPSKKDLLREIAEFTDLFEVNSLSRTNVANLVVIRDLVAREGLRGSVPHGTLPNSFLTFNILGEILWFT